MRRGAQDALPFSLSIGALGIIFGASAESAGISGPAATLMSVLVFSGTAQFATLGLWQHGSGSVLLTTLLLNSRFLLMGAVLSTRLTGAPLWQRMLLGFTVSDESFALMNGPGPRRGVPYLAGVGLMLYLPWVLGTALGVSVGPLVPPGWEQPLTALFPMLFLVLTVRTCDSRPRALVAGIGALLGVGAALWLPAGLHVPAAGLLAAALGPGLDRLEARAGRAVDG